MEREVRRKFGKISLLDVECLEPRSWDTEGISHVRVSIPPTYENEKRMFERGYFLADRTLGVSINLTRGDMDFDKFIRLPVTVASDRNDEIMEIARQSFPDDRRFNISLKPDPAIAEAVLIGWVKELKESYFCEVNGKAVGFLALIGDGEMSRFVYLAAVLKKYRVTGAGFSLYAAAARDCKARGMKFLNGRVSSTNTAVMNLYSHLGASFSDPLDVYLKEI